MKLAWILRKVNSGMNFKGLSAILENMEVIGFLGPKLHGCNLRATEKHASFSLGKS